MPKRKALSSDSASAPVQRYWIGVVGRRDSWERLLAGEHWWCVSGDARVGDQLAMYLTLAVSSKASGIFAIYEVTALDPARAADCKGFGSAVTGLFNVFAHLKLITEVSPVLPLAALRRDAIVANTKFVRRNGQGTAFELSAREFSRLQALCDSTSLR
jgi:hypothetical protein